MREQHRCDLRYGPRMKALSKKHHELAATATTSASASATSSASASASASATGNPGLACKNIYNHPGISAVLDEVMFPRPGPDHDCSIGNWGRWNFQQGGPSATHRAPQLERSEVGAVMTIPGCQDQTIHADTPHLYEHVQLPGHYINLFMPAAKREVLEDFRLGQTAFVCKSHIMQNCAKMMLAAMMDSEDNGSSHGIIESASTINAAASGEIWLQDELIRPHLELGDCLLFDCRVLHFGLGNYTSLVKNADADAAGNNSNGSGIKNTAAYTDTGTGNIRPMLYVNHHYKWFHDRKNWNRDDVLFDCNKRDI